MLWYSAVRFSTREKIPQEMVLGFDSEVRCDCHEINSRFEDFISLRVQTLQLVFRGGPRCGSITFVSSKGQ